MTNVKREKQTDAKGVINLSDRKMTKAEFSLLEKGLTFVPTNRKMDLTGRLTEIKEWERRLRLKKFFFDKEGKDD